MLEGKVAFRSLLTHLNLCLGASRAEVCSRPLAGGMLLASSWAGQRQQPPARLPTGVLWGTSARPIWGSGDQAGCGFSIQRALNWELWKRLMKGLQAKPWKKPTNLLLCPSSFSEQARFKHNKWRVEVKSCPGIRGKIWSAWVTVDSFCHSVMK